MNLQGHRGCSEKTLKKECQKYHLWCGGPTPLMQNKTNCRVVCHHFPFSNTELTSQSLRIFRSLTLPETNMSDIAPEKWWLGHYFPFGMPYFQGNSKNIIKPCPVDLSPNPCLQDLEIWIQAIDEKRRWKTFLSSFNTREISKRRCRRQGEHERFEQQQRWQRWPLTWLLALYWLLHDGIHIIAYWNSHVSNKQPRIFVHCSSRKTVLTPGPSLLGDISHGLFWFLDT